MGRRPDFRLWDSSRKNSVFREDEMMGEFQVEGIVDAEKWK